MFENIFNMVMNVKWKTKDNIKTSIDISLFCHHTNLKLVYDGSQAIEPKANFALDKNTRLLVYQWLKSLRFSYGHASNIVIHVLPLICPMVQANTRLLLLLQCLYFTLIVFEFINV